MTVWEIEVEAFVVFAFVGLEEREFAATTFIGVVRIAVATNSIATNSSIRPFVIGFIAASTTLLII
jgi:hypothetical protein